MSIPIRLSHHVLEKCEERGFDRSAIEAAVLSPDRREDEETVSRFYKRLQEGDSLVVIATRKQDFWLVITAWIEARDDSQD